MNNQEQAMPVLRFPEFNEKWKCMPIKKWLKKVIDYRGKPPPKADEGVSLITARNVKMGYLDFEADEYIDAYQYEGWMNRGLPKSGDVMFTTEAPLGNVARFPKEGKFALGQRIITLQSLPENCDNGFLFQALLAPKMQYEIQSRGTGSTAKGIKSKLFVKIPLSAPDIKEQQKIAAFLGAVDEKIAQLQKKKELLQDYKKGCMQKLFSQNLRFTDDKCNRFPDWEKVKLKKYAKIYDGTHQTPKYVSKGIPFYSVEHVTADNFENTKYIAEDVFVKECKRVKIERNDILLTRIGNIGSCRLVDWDVRASFYVSLALLKLSSGLLPIFANQFVKSDFFQRELWHRTIHVAFPQKINLGEIGECLIKVPCQEEQQKIGAFLSAIDNKIALVAEELDKAKTFKKGLLQQMFV